MYSLFYCVCVAVFTLDVRLLAISQYSDGPATGHLDTGFSWFPCIYKQMLRRFPTFTLDAGLLARSQYPEGPATGHLDTGFSWFPCVYKQMLRWFPTFQVATACFSYSPSDLNLLDPYFIFMYMHNNHCHRATAHLKLNI